jgi:magnesium chelatase family protein
LFDSKLLLDREARVDLGAAIDALALSGRGVDRLLRVARTVADLEQNEQVSRTDLFNALSFRLLPSDERAAA